MSDEEDRRLRRVSQKLERRGFSLGLTEISPGKWRADAWFDILGEPRRGRVSDSGRGLQDGGSRATPRALG